MVSAAPTNSAAYNVGGTTVHSLFRFFGKENSDERGYTNLSGESLKDLPIKLKDLGLLFLDEISMIGATMFHKIHFRCEDIFPPAKGQGSFSGLDLVTTGDFHQLQPVLDRMIFEPPTLRGLVGNLTKNHWKENTVGFQLTEKMRSKDDEQFGELCDNIARGELSIKNRLELESRVKNADENPIEQSHEVYKDGNLMTLCLENKIVDEINQNLLENSNPETTIHTFHAIDKFSNLSHDVPTVTQSYTQTGGLPTILKVKVNSPVLLTQNIDREDGLVNGQRGYVHEVQDEVIWVQFFDENCGHRARQRSGLLPNTPNEKAVPIMKAKSPVQFSLGKGRARVTRKGIFPLVLAYATTVHKAQGMTLSNVILDFRAKGKIPYGAFYTACTRVKSLNNLFLRNFKIGYVKTDPKVLKEVKRLQENHPYVPLKKYLDFPVFENVNEELKVGYMNINGLKSHLKDIKCDHNLNNCNIIAFAETKLDHHDHFIEIPGFKILYRMDHHAGSCGIIIYKKEGTNAKVLSHSEPCKNDYPLEVITIEAYHITMSFVYIHPVIAKKEMQVLKSSVESITSDIVMGDFNIDTAKKLGKVKLKSIFPAYKIHISGCTFGRQETASSLDHVLIKETFTASRFVSSFKNIYSDHSAISVRVPIDNEDAKYCDPDYVDASDIYDNHRDIFDKKSDQGYQDNTKEINSSRYLSLIHI